MKKTVKTFINPLFFSILMMSIFCSTIITGCHHQLGNKHISLKLKCNSSATNENMSVAAGIIRNRLISYGVSEGDISITVEEKFIMMDVKNADNPSRIITLVTRPGKLEFFETIEFQKAWPFLEDANKKMAKILKSEDSSTTKNDNISVNSLKDQKKKTTDADTVSLISKVKSGSNAKDRNFEEYKKANPLFAYLKPNFEEKEGKNYFGKGPTVGYSLITDTAKVNSVLRRKEISFIFPSYYKFSWERTPFDDKKTNLRLIALKTEDNGNAALDGSCIVDARQEKSSQGNIEISMTMNGEGARIWKSLTGQHIGECIAIILDNYVYSFPTVQSEIPNGRSQITGNFSLEEAKDFANILRSHWMPVNVTVVDSTITEQPK